MDLPIVIGLVAIGVFFLLLGEVVFAAIIVLVIIIGWIIKENWELQMKAMSPDPERELYCQIIVDIDRLHALIVRYAVGKAAHALRKQ